MNLNERLEAARARHRRSDAEELVAKRVATPPPAAPLSEATASEPAVPEPTVPDVALATTEAPEVTVTRTPASGVRVPEPEAEERPAAPPPAARALDPLADLKEHAAQELFVRIGARLNDPSLTEEGLHELARAELSRIVAAEPVALSVAERNRLLDEIGADVLGYGPLEGLLEDETITEIMVNRFDQIYVEREGRIVELPARFSSEAQLRRVIERVVSRVGRRIDESSPLVDARLEDGSRVNAIIPPLAVNGASLTVRKFSRVPLTAADLVAFGTMSEGMRDVLDAAVRGRLNILVSGGTGTGKTTLLNVLSAFIPSDERIITIEDAVELQLQQEHVVRLESRPPNIEGRGEVTIRDLVRNSLRMRPDRIVIGEVRGGESLDMLQAMNTGHEGSISTIHANSPRDAISRMETLVLMAGMDLPLRAVREQIASSLDLIVQIARMKDGQRRVTHVTEVQGMEGEVITLQDAFLFDYDAGIDDDGKFLGHAVATGIRPRFVEHLHDVGIRLDPSLFGDLATAPRRAR
ncbi:CpaF family protein [uncultured Schumannella sp.]|uniref:CpaF family protein n=1 Tax=uncultured Schumannella sp. TaxID=1195956 RepID=UPI0025E33084|nr:CpaF family protein [uncultured Schumannella sp.]